MLESLFRLLGIGGAPTPGRIAPDWVEPAVLKRRLDAGETPLIVDVRGADEFDGPLGHLPGAVNIPLGDLPMHQPELAAANRPIVLVCLTDKRSATAAGQLAQAGIGNVAVLRGGTQAWRQQGR